MKIVSKPQVAFLLLLVFVFIATLFVSDNVPEITPSRDAQTQQGGGAAVNALETLLVKGRSPKTGYERSEFGSGWESQSGCSTRNEILLRDLENATVDENCFVLTGTLTDPYTGNIIAFVRGETSSQDVQIDHVVSLSDAWQKGAQQMDRQARVAFANDPLNLLAVDGLVNQQKSDGDAATWLPPNKAYRCNYVARQIAVKQKYSIWVTEPEKRAMLGVLSACPQHQLPVIDAS